MTGPVTKDLSGASVRPLRPPGLPGLRVRLLKHVMLPLALTWLAGTLVALFVAQYFAGRAFDRSLLDDAYMVASNVKGGEGSLRLDLSPHEVDAVLFDQAESVVFSVQTQRGDIIAGQSRLRAELLESDLPYQFYDLSYEGRAMRAVTLRRDEPGVFYVVLAQTNNSRNTLLHSLLLYSIAPQLAVLAVLAFWLTRAIDRDLQPLLQLRHVVEQRGESDLTPIEFAPRTRDVEQLGLAINSLLARLEHSLQAQREFTGNVAHELRTPLAGIRALAEYGLAQKDAPVWRTQLERIAGSEARASRMVDQLLALAFADEVRAGVPLEPVALDVQVSDAVMRFLPRADAEHIDLGARGIDAPVTVHANRTLVEGILNNLIDNALRYAKPGDGSQPSVTVEISQDANGTTLSVSDNGPGLSPGLRDRLVNRWSQGEAGQLLGQGVGLGLGIVQQYAQLVNSRLDLGAGPDGQGLVACVVFATAEPAQSGGSAPLADQA